MLHLSDLMSNVNLTLYCRPVRARMVPKVRFQKYSISTSEEEIFGKWNLYIYNI